MGFWVFGVNFVLCGVCCEITLTKEHTLKLKIEKMKRIFTLLIIIFFGLNVYSQNCNIGNQILTADFIPAGLTPNYLNGTKYTLSEESTLHSINLIGNNTGEGVQMAVYDDNAGVPNNLMAASDSGIVGDGIVSLSVTPTVLPAGEYWVMAVYEIGGEPSYCTSNTSGLPISYYNLQYGDTIPANASDFTVYLDFGLDFSYFLELECGNTLSSEDLSWANNITVFPNPSADFITISDLEVAVNYVIVNVLGQEVLRGIHRNEKIDISDLDNGLYFLKIEDGNILKFVKK